MFAFKPFVEGFMMFSGGTKREHRVEMGYVLGFEVLCENVSFFNFYFNISLSNFPFYTTLKTLKNQEFSGIFRGIQLRPEMD